MPSWAGSSSLNMRVSRASLRPCPDSTFFRGHGESGPDDRPGVPEQSLLVVLYLHEALAVGARDGTHRLVLAVERVRADERVGEVHLRQEPASDGHLALPRLSFLARDRGHGHGRTVLHVDHGDDSHDLLDELSVERELSRERPLLCGHPFRELPGEVVEVQRPEEVVYRHVARDLVLVLCDDP